MAFLEYSNPYQNLRVVLFLADSPCWKCYLTYLKTSASIESGDEIGSSISVFHRMC